MECITERWRVCTMTKRGAHGLCREMLSLLSAGYITADSDAVLDGYQILL